MRLMRRASYWLARSVTPRIRAMPLDMLEQELELALLRGLVQLPAVVRSGSPSPPPAVGGSGSRARPVLASQVSEQVVLDAASAVGRGADVEHALSIPEDIHA